MPLLRSVLYLPASNARALEKAKSLNVDALIFDLEDAVADEVKIDARDMVCAAVKQGGYGQRKVITRINGFDTQWGQEDWNAVCAVKPDVILIPKVNEASDIQNLCVPEGIQIWAMIETPLSVLNVKEIAACVKNLSLSALVLGSNDLSKDLHLGLERDSYALNMSMSMLVLAARAYGLSVLDGVWNHIEDLQGLQQEAQKAKAFGFDGKTIIHPHQVETVNAVFSPSDRELKQFQDIIVAFSLSENKDKAVLRVNGQMVERLHFEQAKRQLGIEK